MKTLREEFEAVYALKYERDTGHQLSTPLCELREDDHYGADRTYLNAAWEWWQASRAALAVELPEVEYFGDSWSGGWALRKDDVVEALTDAGIPVKP